MTTMLISFNGTTENGQFMGDQVCSVKAAYLFVQNTPGVDKVLLAMSPLNQLHFLWQKFIDTYRAEVIWDNWHPGNMEQRFENWNKWRKEREIEGRPFDHYRELYRRIDGSNDAKRQLVLCGGENGSRRKNIFEYWFYGQENFKPNCPDVPIINGDHFDDTLIYHKKVPADRDVYIAPLAKCQGNYVFTFDFWAAVVHKLIHAGITVTVGHNGSFCEELQGNPLYRKYWGTFDKTVEEICRHKLVACGNTGIGWFAAMCGTPLLAMQPPNSNMPDYRYEDCGVKSLVEFLDFPDADYCARRIIEEVNRVTVLTTGCYDILHAGHVRHLQASRAMGTRLVVALNSDSSVRRLKGMQGGMQRPINTQEDRAAILRALRCVDEVRIFDGDDAMNLIQEIKPMVLTNGYGYTADKIVGKEFVEQYGGRACISCESNREEPSTTKIVQKIIRPHDILKAVQDAGSVSPNPFDKLKLLADQFLTTATLQGEVADVGAYRGGCSLILRRLSPEKTLHVFDTWKGNPHHDPLCHHGPGEWTADIAECKALVGENDKTFYHQGIFPATAESLADRTFCFACIDPDTYQSVKDAIAFFWPRLVTGGKLFFDDFAHTPCAGVEKAIREEFTDDQLTIYPSLFTCVVVKK